MTLTLGKGPFGRQSAGEFNFRREGPAHVLYFEKSPRRIRVRFGGEIVADSRRAKLLHETGLLPVYYFPRDDVRMDRLEATDHQTHCPFKGDARYWTLQVGDRVAENAVWEYPDPLEHSPPLAGHLAFYWQRMDGWLEEDEELTGHPRDPYHRVDVCRASRHVRVRVHGETVAETDRPKVLFETGLPPRFYVPADAVRAGSLVDSETTTRCPYKGIARYFTVRTAQGRAGDAAFAYDQPHPEATAIEGHLCFLADAVQTEVDGELLAE